MTSAYPYYFVVLILSSLIGLWRFRALSLPIQLVAINVVAALINETLIHFVFKDFRVLFNTYFVYAIINFGLYHAFYAAAACQKRIRMISLAVGLTFWIAGILYDAPNMNDSFPAGSIVLNTIGILINSLIFIKDRLHRPDEKSLRDDSEFMLVLFFLFFWTTFISKHALQNAAFKYNEPMEWAEQSFTVFALLFYGLIGVVFFRHGKQQPG